MPKLIDVDARRRQIAEALWAITADEGLAAVSIRSVAARAGISAGSLRHVFPSRADLVVYSVELVIERVVERIRAVPKGDDAEEYAYLVCSELLPLTPESRLEMEVNTALVVEAVRVPELVRVRDEAFRGLADLCSRLVTSLAPTGHDPAELSASAGRLHALVDGLALHLLQGPGDEDPAWALRILHAELTEIRRGDVRP